MSSTPTNTDDVIDSRDIIERLEELQTEIDDAKEAAGNRWDNDEEARGDLSRDEFIAEHIDVSLGSERDELAALVALDEEASQYSSDWRHGETLIRRSYWVEYVQDLVSDIGDMPKEIPSYIAIDWDQTAENIKADYTTVDFDGVEYLMRSC